jgi:hypothetical protein
MHKKSANGHLESTSVAQAAAAARHLQNEAAQLKQRAEQIHEDGDKARHRAKKLHRDSVEARKRAHADRKSASQTAEAEKNRAGGEFAPAGLSGVIVSSS